MQIETEKHRFDHFGQGPITIFFSKNQFSNEQQYFRLCFPRFSLFEPQNFNATFEQASKSIFHDLRMNIKRFPHNLNYCELKWQKRKEPNKKSRLEKKKTPHLLHHVDDKWWIWSNYRKQQIIWKKRKFHAWATIFVGPLSICNSIVGFKSVENQKKPWKLST